MTASQDRPEHPVTLRDAAKEVEAELRFRASMTNAAGQIRPPYTAPSLLRLADLLAVERMTINIDWERAWKLAAPVVVAARRFVDAEAEGNSDLISDAHFGLLRALADYRAEASL